MGSSWRQRGSCQGATTESWLSYLRSTLFEVPAGTRLGTPFTAAKDARRRVL